MSESVTYEGSCLCGGVKLEVAGPPIAAGLCHCESCRRWHAAPINAWARWPREAVTVTDGEELIHEYDTGTSARQWCKRCGSALMNRKPDGIVVVYAMALAISNYVHEPAIHIHYRERVFDVADGLPKFAELPTERGGSGRTIAEPGRSGMPATGA